MSFIKCIAECRNPNSASGVYVDSIQSFEENSENTANKLKQYMNSILFRRTSAGGFITITSSADFKAGLVGHGLPLIASPIPSHDGINILAHTAGFSQPLHVVKQNKDV